MSLVSVRLWKESTVLAEESESVEQEELTWKD